MLTLRLAHSGYRDVLLGPDDGLLLLRRRYSWSQSEVIVDLFTGTPNFSRAVTPRFEIKPFGHVERSRAAKHYVDQFSNHLTMRVLITLQYDSKCKTNDSGVIRTRDISGANTTSYLKRSGFVSGTR